MNRWQGWAQRLRSRHGRIDAWQGPGAMVLRRGPGAATHGVRTQVRRVSHQHAHFFTISPLISLSLRPVQARALGQTTVMNVAALGGSVRHASAVGVAANTLALPARRSAEEAAPRSAAPAFVPVVRHGASAVRTPSQAAPSQRQQLPGTPLYLSVRRREIASSVTVHATEIALRLKRNATRQEMPLPAQPIALASPERAALRAAAANIDTAAPMPRDRSQSPPAQPQTAPPFNVEALTGMVIQQIDRRLLAYRERMGRA